MVTPSQLKSNIDSQITNKTVAGSISATDVGSRMKDIVDLTIPLQFTSSASRLAYLTSADAKPFQLADDKEDGNKYYINKDGSNWVLVSVAVPQTEILYFTNLSQMAISWTNIRKAKFGNAGSFVVEVLCDDSKYRVAHGLEIIPDDINNTNTYTINFGGSQTGRVIIK